LAASCAASRRQGIRQFLDIGPGLPIQTNVNETAQEAA
jgi:hypothetical protein